MKTNLHSVASAPPTPTAGRPVSEVEASIGNLQEELNGLAALTGHLMERLNPVIRPVNAGKDATSEAHPPPPMAPVTREIQICREMVEMIRNNLSAAIDLLAI